uniref:Terpene synthase family, metal binding domain containing protein, expressed n=1 Tax=Oryza sativa subsp. japonica TaxID=39947 RepID=Q10L24_ORYSJ|nr:Terpene synthase family, metal binding domain containing protein, expressed [Oryza sativa Japonica Group]
MAAMESRRLGAEGQSRRRRVGGQRGRPHAPPAPPRSNSPVATDASPCALANLHQRERERDLGRQEEKWGTKCKYVATLDRHRSEEWMRERVDRLKMQVGCKILKTINVPYTVMLVDVLERLHIDNHFRDEIATALQHVFHHDEQQKAAAGFDDGDQLYLESLRFRLLRQHGFWVSADVFDKFKDSTGCFRESLSTDARGLLSLYNAAHLAMPGEAALDDAIAFSRRSLQSLQGALRSPMAKQVSRALDIPLPRAPKLLETMHYITEYEQEAAHDGMVLELARLDFELVRSLYLKELKALSLWWRQLYDSVQLSYARDCLVESYFWTCAMFHGEDYSRARIIFAKVFQLMTMTDDIYDIHATLEECYKFNEAVQRWDKSAVSILPEYLRNFYIRILNDFDEMEDSLEPDEKHRMSYVKSSFKQQSEYYLREAQWSSDKHMPSFAEHLDVSFMSIGYPTMAVVVLLCARDGDGAAASMEASEWAPSLVRAGGEVTRFLNDIASYKTGKSGKDAASTIECYMAERGVGGEEAVAAVAALVESAWRTINRACVEMDPNLLPAARLLVNLATTPEVIYFGGRDGYTVGADLKGLVTALFLDPLRV